VASRPALNCQIGTLEALLPTGRWQVRMDGSAEVVGLKPESLRWVERAAPTQREATAAAASAATGGWKPGELALVSGVLRRPDLNGQIVSLVAFLPSGRWQARVLSTDAEVGIRPENLRFDSSVSGPATGGADSRGQPPSSAQRAPPSAAPSPGASADADDIARRVRELGLGDELFRWLLRLGTAKLVSYLRSIERPTTGNKAELVQRIFA